MDLRPLRTVALGTVVAASLLLAACGSSDSTTPADPPATSSRAAKGAIEVTGAWARTSPSMATAGAAYLEIANTGQTDDALLSVTIDPSIAKKVELHETTIDKPDVGDTSSTMPMTTTSMSGGSMPAGGGAPVMKMSQVDRIGVAAGKTATLEPGGYHIMMLGLSKPLEVGSKLDLTLTFEKAGDVKTVAEVRDTAP